MKNMTTSHKSLLTLTLSLLSLMSVATSAFAGETDCNTCCGNVKVKKNAIHVSGVDLITKYFGISPYSGSLKQATESAQLLTNITPSEEGNNLWLDSSDGYNLCYNGMTPDVAAVIMHNDDYKVCSHAFFFMFPYTCESRCEAVENQSAFCGILLQELHDMGLEMAVNVLSDALFDVTTQYEGNTVQLRLTEENVPDDMSGRFIMTLSVEQTTESPLYSANF